MGLTQRIRECTLTPGERRVADLTLGEPSRVAFGTVATVAAAAGVGNSTVMRFAATVGFDGFRELQRAVRAEMDGRLRQATHRVRQHPSGDPIDRTLEVEIANVQQTFARLDRAVAAAAAEALARAARIVVVAGDGARGVAQDFGSQLAMVRTGVELADVGSIALSRSTSWLDRHSVLVVIDTARYERSVALAAERAAAHRVPVLAVSDSHVSPVGALATWSFQVSDAGGGPFDSFVGALALTNLLVNLVTRRLGKTAVRHLDRLEADWDAIDALRPAE